MKIIKGNFPLKKKHLEQFNSILNSKSIRSFNRNRDRENSLSVVARENEKKEIVSIFYEEK